MQKRGRFKKMRGKSSSSRSAAAAANSSIYWDSVDSSGGSSSVDSGSRNYVDPWDLENYAYIRRHSVATAAPIEPQPIYHYQRSSSNNHHRSSRMSHHSHVEPDYWYAPSAIREPGYDAPATVEELYFRPARPYTSANCYYHHQPHLPQQPIYEDEESFEPYAALPAPLYAHLSELEHADEYGTRRRSKLTGYDYPREECIYHRRPNEIAMTDVPALRSRYAEEESVDEVDTVRYREPVRPSHITYNTYGHLKIDYTNSWNSLHRKILSK